MSTALVEALKRLMRSFPTDFDMQAAGWGRPEIEEACSAHDAARAALAQAEAAQPAKGEQGPLGVSVICPWCLNGFTMLAAPQPAEAAPKQEAVALPTVPASVMLHVHAYGDARADDEPSHEHLKAAVLEMRRWAGSLAAQPQQPAPEPVAQRCPRCWEPMTAPQTPATTGDVDTEGRA